MTTVATPGPWRVARDGMAVIAGDRSPYQIVASMHLKDFYDEPGDLTAAAAIGEANMRLIAAAPGMRDALQRAADTFADIAKVAAMLGKPAIAESCRIAEADARKEIANAEGDA